MLAHIFVCSVALHVYNADFVTAHKLSCNDCVCNSVSEMYRGAAVPQSCQLACLCRHELHMSRPECDKQLKQEQLLGRVT